MMTLAPCPFCGGEAEFERTGTGRRSCIVRCRNCSTVHESSDAGDLSGSSWNSRESAAHRGAEPVLLQFREHGSEVWLGYVPLSATLKPEQYVYRPLFTAPPASTRGAVDAALERAAMICDGVNGYDNPMTAGDCADAIRALKTEATDKGSGMSDDSREAFEEELAGHPDLYGNIFSRNRADTEYMSDVVQSAWIGWQAGRASVSLRSDKVWIPVSERLPEPCQDVIVWPYPTEYCMTACYYPTSQSWNYGVYETSYGHQDYTMIPPTHWMPLPAPPTQEPS